MSLENELVEEESLEEWKSEPPADEAKDLYLGHEIKGELTIGPTSLQPPDSAFVPRGRGPDELPPDSTPQRPDTSLVAITHSMQPSAQLHIPYDILDPQKKLHPCETCKKQFVSESMLANHVARVHTGDKPDSKNLTVNHSAKLEGVCVEDIKNRAFSKRILIKRGRCTPDLPLMKANGKIKQKFNKKHYKLHSWLTGCVHSNRLFCFFCLLFSRGNTGWNDTGYTDVRNLPAAAKKHEQSEKHIEAHFKFKTFVKNSGEKSLNSENQFDIDGHNATVNRNRNIFRRLIDIVCFVGNQDLAFCGHDESASDNMDIYLKMVNFLAKHDGVLESYLDSSTTTYTGLQIQTDLISSVAAVLDDNIRKEISATDFVAVMVDETPNVSGKEHLVVILRYFRDSEVCNRFIKYVDISSDRSAKTISDAVLKTLLDFNCLSKLRAQTYDGAALLSYEINDIQSLVRQKAPHAIYVWCPAHELNVLLSNACQRIPETKRFFHIIKTLINFFHTSKRQNHYNKMADLKQLPRFSEEHWTYNSRILNIIVSSCPHLIDLFGDMADNEDSWDGETLYQASSLLYNLKDFEFQFLLRVFNEIFVETDALYQIIQKNTSCVAFCVDKIKEFESFLESLRTRFEVIFEDVKRIVGPPKRKRNAVVEVKDSFKLVFNNILADIFAECHDRYQNFEELSFFQMLSCKNFAAYNERFPSELINEFGNAYKSSEFNVDRLKNELKCIYKSDEFRNMSFYDIIQHFHENRINEVFPESFRLAKLIVTIPASSASCDKSLSSLKRMHTYLINTQGQPRLTDPSKISIEKTLFTELKRLPNFYDSILQIYLQKDGRSDLIYK